jgi:hypothetical protein
MTVTSARIVTCSWISSQSLNVTTDCVFDYDFWPWMWYLSPFTVTQFWHVKAQ